MRADVKRFIRATTGKDPKQLRLDHLKAYAKEKNVLVPNDVSIDNLYISLYNATNCASIGKGTTPKLM